MFGTWTALSCIIRLVAAYHINDLPMYYIVLCSYVLAFAHFGSEWLVFGTMKSGRGLAPVLGVSASSIVWMLVQSDFYLTP